MTKRQFELACGHCGAVFMGSYKQQWNQRHGLTTPYCVRQRAAWPHKARRRRRGLLEGVRWQDQASGTPAVVRITRSPA